MRDADDVRATEVDGGGDGEEDDSSFIIEGGWMPPGFDEATTAATAAADSRQFAQYSAGLLHFNHRCIASSAAAAAGVEVD